MLSSYGSTKQQTSRFKEGSLLTLQVSRTPGVHLRERVHPSFSGRSSGKHPLSHRRGPGVCPSDGRFEIECKVALITLYVVRILLIETIHYFIHLFVNSMS